jgi:acyl-CoA thioester hydrolase
MAKTAWEHSRALGLDFDAYARINRGMVVRRHELEYFAPSHEGDRIHVATWITGNDGRIRLRRRFQMVKPETGATLLRGLSDFVCINIETGKASRMPAHFVETYRLTARVDGDN